MSKDLVSLRESCTITTCLCCGICSVLTATKIVFAVSVIVALLEFAIGVCIISGGFSNEDTTTATRTKLAILGITIVLGQCCRIFVLTYWLLASRKDNSMKSHTASACCICFSMILILGLLALSAAYCAVATGPGPGPSSSTDNNFFYSVVVFNTTFIFIVVFDLCFSLMYALCIAKLPPQYRVDEISERRKVLSDSG